MNENEFRTRYAASQSHVEASPELKQRAVCNALQEGAAQYAGSQAPAKGAVSAKRPTRRRPRPVSRTAGHSVGAASLARRWAPAAAACLVAGIPALTSSLSGSPAITLDEAAARCGFSVRAYASDGSAPLAPGEGGTVAFDRDLGYRFRGGDDYKVSGFFSGCLFHVEGEGIVRVQAHLTGGALYRVTFEDGPTDPDDPRMGELASWKPTARGTGEHYGGYDFVGSAMRDGESKLSLAKLMGATIDVSADDDPGIADGTTSFGLWTNEGEVPENAANNPESPVSDLFDGQTLTVTVTFEDGSISTQAIELHVANFETEMVDGTPRLTPRLAADDAEAGTSAKSLYGTVVEAGNGPFPFPRREQPRRRGAARRHARTRRGDAPCVDVLERRAARCDARQHGHVRRGRDRGHPASPTLRAGRRRTAACRRTGLHYTRSHAAERQDARRIRRSRQRVAGQPGIFQQVYARALRVRVQR